MYTVMKRASNWVLFYSLYDIHINKMLYSGCLKVSSIPISTLMYPT